jgi:L-ascorbate metabolism protein UlaG (beta-lactamase superfamily)
MKELNLDNIRILIHSAIRIEGSKVLYFDPYHLTEEPHDADVIFVTHDHYDHFSPEDIRKITHERTLLVAPLSCKETVEQSEVLPKDRLVFMEPGDSAILRGILAAAVRAYNVNKKFHPKEKDWLGYIVTMDGISYYVAGDTDATPELLSVQADIALLPVGGTYTMTADEAAVFVNHLKPKAAVPTHYGDIVGSEGDAAHFCRLLDPEIGSALCRD